MMSNDSVTAPLLLNLAMGSELVRWGNTQLAHHRKVGEECLRGGRRGRHEFIARNFRGNAHAPVFGGLDTHNFSQAADIHIARLRDLLWKNDNKFDLAANFEIGIGKEVQAAVTDIPRARVHFPSFGIPRQKPHRKAHRESPRFAAFRSITHQHPLGLSDSEANIGTGKLQRENQEILS
jgi:hypothetical protein